MALSATILQRVDGVGPARLVVIQVTGDASYPTGGYAVTPAMFGFNSFLSDGLGSGLPPVAANYAIMAEGVGNVFAGINPANGNLRLYVTTTGVEVVNATSETTYTAFLEAYGT